MKLFLSMSILKRFDNTNKKVKVPRILVGLSREINLVVYFFLL
jgi:hypothetical protein